MSTMAQGRAATERFDQPVAHTPLEIADCRMAGTLVLGDEEWEYPGRAAP
jgi:hypothetical protein